MAPPNPQSSFHLRINVDFTEIRRRLRSEYGTAIQSDADNEISNDIDKDLDDCDAEVRRLQSRIIFLQNHRERLEEYKGCLRFLRSPIRRLPNEAVLRVFNFACDINVLTSKKLQTMPALVISSVCYRWRNLAKSCPDLWSRIELEMWTMPRRLPGLPILDLYLDSSKQAPLTIKVPRTEIEALEPGHLQVCAALGACSNRWQRLTVWRWVIYEAIVAHNPLDFPFLERLELPNIVNNDILDLLHRFQGASNFHALSLARTPLVQLQDGNRDLLMRLTLLDIAQCDNRMKHIFERSSNLKALHFRQFHDDAIKLCSPPLSAPFVEELTLTLRQTSCPAPEILANVIFASITCPSLTSLFIEADDETGYKHEWPRDAANGFVSRSSFHLTTLSIKSIPLSDSDLIDLLRLLPSLLHLTVDDSRIPANSPSPITTRLSKSLHALHRRSSVAISSPLVQKLQSLSLTFKSSKAEGTFDKEFVDMVSSRWFPNHYADGYRLDTMDSGSRTACLRSVVMRFKNRYVDEEIYRPLKYFEEEGMMVVVVGKNS